MVPWFVLADRPFFTVVTRTVSVRPRSWSWLCFRLWSGSGRAISAPRPTFSVHRGVVGLGPRSEVPLSRFSVSPRSEIGARREEGSVTQSPGDTGCRDRQATELPGSF